MDPAPPTGRARGRARGRGRSQQAQQQQAGGDRRPGDPPPAAAPTPAVGAAAAPPSRASHRQGGDPPIQEMASLKVASSVGGSAEAQASSSGNGAASVGRGAMRGRSERPARPPMEVTRPAHIVTKTSGIGNPIPLMVNYYRMVDKTKWSIKQYRVDFDPPEDSTRFRKILLRAHQARLGQHYIFDGTMLFLERALPECTEDKTLELISKKNSDDSNVRILIKFTCELPPADHQFINIFNIITNQCMSMIGYTKLRAKDREFFDLKKAAQADRGRLEIWPGFGAAVNQFEHEVLMCISVSHKVLRNDTVLDNLSSLQQQFPRDVQNMAERRLLGSVVMCRHNLRMYKIDHILWDKTPMDSFDYKGNMMPLFEYYKQKHNIEVKRDQPLLLSRPKLREMRQGQTTEFWLVPELCNMTGLSDDMRANNSMMRELSAYLNMAPRERVQKLQSFSSELNSNAEVQSLLSFWGLNFSKDLLKIQGRVLPNEMVRTNVETRARDGTWNDAVKSGVASFVPLERWMLFYTQRTQAQAATCLTSVMRVAKGFGMPIAEPRKVLVQDDRVQGYVQALEQNLNEQAQLIMCIIPSKDKTRYDAIKQLLCVRRPFPSQVVTARLIATNKNLLGVATKIALQLNCKLGGVPWEVKIPTKGVMVIGYDTYHESQQKNASAGAWVASLNQNCSRYHSIASIHKDREEISNQMQTFMTMSMEAYKRENGSYPNNVVMYRDGIGEGSVRHVHQHEINSIKAAIEPKSPDTKLCFIIVTKNINTRIFAQGGRGVDNPPPGTVIDDVVTRPERYDFYLVSQKTRIGTVTPTMYNVVVDETTFKPQHLQMLSYKLSHMYFNLTSTVRVPAPSHYAHRLAFLVGQSLHQPHSNRLANELFFL